MQTLSCPFIFIAFMFLATIEYLDMTSSIHILCLHTPPCLGNFNTQGFDVHRKSWNTGRPPSMSTEEGQIFFLIILITVINIHFPDRDYGSPALSLCCFSQSILDLSYRTETHPLSSHWEISSDYVIWKDALCNTCPSSFTMPPVALSKTVSCWLRCFTLSSKPLQTCLSPLSLCTYGRGSPERLRNWLSSWMAELDCITSFWFFPLGWAASYVTVP